jgi:protein SCO1/2
MDVVMWQREPIGGPFRLTDHRGRPRSDQAFRGQLLLVYFGFTTCASLCPTDLLEIGQALRLAPGAGTQVTPLFITLDPARDTRQILANYVGLFHPRMVALTGSGEQIRRVAEQFKVYHARVEVGGGMGYTIDHSSYIYLMDRQGRYLGFLPPGSTAERIAQVLQPHLKPHLKPGDTPAAE